MRKLLLFTVALLCAASMWAQDPVVEGPWTQLAKKSHTSTKDVCLSMEFVNMDDDQWSGTTITPIQDGDGVSFIITGKSDTQHKMGIFSTYKKEVELPAYSCLTLTWKYQLRSKSTKHHSSTCLYALQGTEDDINSLEVDFSNHHDSNTGADNLLDCYVNKAQDGETKKAGEKTATFVFDNYGGTDQQTKAWYLLLTHVIASGDGKSGLKEWGSFLSKEVTTTWTYRSIITFDANGGTGDMEVQTIDGTGKLQANEFTREDYVFAGWAKTPDGDVIYPDGAVVTIPEDFKGPQTLYAKWTGWGNGKKEGPWTFLEMKTDSCNPGSPKSITFSAMNGKQWPGTIYNVGDELGAGYTYGTVSPEHSKLGIFSTYMYEVNVPSYTSMTLNWQYKIGSKSTKHHSALCLYALEGTYDSIANRLSVDYSEHYDSETGAENLLNYYVNREQDGKQRYTSAQTATFAFDNSEGISARKDTCFMMMTYVIASSGAKTGLNENGFFKSISADTTWTYYKYITFEKNAEDAGGMMSDLHIANSGNLPTNSFRRSGYTFQGWATDPIGDVIYANEAAITATANDKGPVTLYAKWAEGGAPVNPDVEGPWTWIETKTGTSAKSENAKISFNGLNSLYWDGTVSRWTNYGIGYSFAGTSPSNSKMGIFSTYEAQATVPAYTYMYMTWTFKLYSKSNKHYSTVCLYGSDGTYDNVKNLEVPFKDEYDDVNLEAPLLAWFCNTKENNKVSKADKSIIINFDNREGSTEQLKKSYMIMAYMLEGSSSESTSGVNEAGSFQSVRIDTTWIYCKTITFDPNGGTGVMPIQYIYNGGRLQDNIFTRENYTFQGWATAADGDVIYANEAEITATATDKGPVTLYAKWAEGGGAAAQVEGPWTRNDMKSMSCSKSANASISFSDLDNTKWDGEISGWKDGDGIGYTYTGKSPDEKKMAIFSTYLKQVDVPSYSSMKLTWTFKLNSKSSKHHSATCLYGYPDSYSGLIALQVDFSNHYDSEAGNKYLLARAFINKDHAGHTLWSPEQTSVFVFDNSNGSTDATKSWYLMLTHVMSTSGGKSDLYEWGAFKSVKVQQVWSYYKIITLHANGGAGQMTGPVIENEGNLPANTFVRGGYTFAGWATAPDGDVVYADKAAITATSEDKGLLDLYAVWTPNEYAIAYELNGGTASNPVVYAENAALAINDPTKIDYTFLGWTGSNGDVPQTGVAIAKGSKGNKSFTANWISNAVAYTIDLIDLIGVVENTPESKAKIDDARDAYDALSEEEQAFVSNYATLLAAEAAYAAFDPSIIKFMEQDGTTQIGDDRLIAIYYPEAPVIAGFTFKFWQTIAEDVTAGTIRLQAVYTKDEPTDIEDVDAKANAEKFIKNGNVYILKEEFIYTINGQKVK